MLSDSEFTELFRQTRQYVLAAIRRHLFAEIDAVDDIIQETYIRAYNALKKNQFRGDARISTYIYRIAANECHRWNARHSREKQKKEILKNQPEPDTKDPHHGISEQELVAKIQLVPEPFRAVLSLFAAGKSEQEIAHELGVSSGTVKSRKSRGKKYLQKIWEGRSNES
ncbi:MAG: RNA polymerase sigma factor [Spirochaetales bacterium]|nr:RNA polymerase sigma factor [Spirochaetales bacterium]